ncbi:MAG: polysaccharide deacetylase family protein [Thermodesulfobacteriota bacterium]
MRSPLSLLILLLCLGAPPLALAGATAFPGSEALLRGLWTPEELRGTPAEAAPASAGATACALPPAHPLPETPLPEELRGSIRSVDLPPGTRAVALTFDLCELEGETSGYAGDVVDALRAHSARATFFASGKWLLTHPERAMQLAADPLFELGGHGFAHRNPRLQNAAGRAREIGLTLGAYARVRERLAARATERGLAGEMEKAPAALRLWRFPYGACNPAALDELARAGLPAVQWDVVSGDPDPAVTAEGMAREVLRRVRPGSIVIFHANGRGHGAARALDLILPELARRGYALVTASELLGLGRPRAATQCYSRKPGDLDRYDRPGR